MGRAGGSVEWALGRGSAATRHGHTPACRLTLRALKFLIDRRVMLASLASAFKSRRCIISSIVVVVVSSSHDAVAMFVLTQP